MNKYGCPPVPIAPFLDVDLDEVMYYLYLPVKMPDTGIRMPPNLTSIYGIVTQAIENAENLGKTYDYVYVSARKGWATPDNPLNRPGWHTDGFGTNDLNYIWWAGPGTRFLVGGFVGISEDHTHSLKQFEHLAKEYTYAIRERYREKILYRIDPYVIHATPLITVPCWRQYVKVSLSNERYNLENNSHNYMFQYDWPLVVREEVRNDPHKAGRDYA